MIRKIKIAVLILLFGSFISTYGQNKIDLSGKVVDKKSNEPVIGAAVGLSDLDLWTVSDENGIFEFKGIFPKIYTLEVRCLCYEPYASEFDVTKRPLEPLEILLVPTSYEMEEVNVLAKKGTNIASSTTIGSAAIEYVQATSLSDVMQLLPGNIVENPDLSKPQQISIRQIGSDDNTAMGTTILVDNAPLSNNANLQTISTSVSREGEFSTVASGGTDLRRISTDNIESVEVIKGIPSVVYGDLTSGAVVVKTKAGYSPWSVRLKADPNIKQAAFTKGIQFPSTISSLNFSFDYLSSYSDVTSKYKGFKRLTGQTGYSTTFMRSNLPLTFNARFNLFGTIDNAKTDPDALVANEEYESRDQGIGINLNGEWSLNKKWLTSIQYTYSITYGHQVSYQKLYRSSSGGVQAVSLAMEEGENVGVYLPTEQLTELTVDGKPVNAFAQMTFNKVMNLENGMINKVLAGGEYRMDGNYGEGQIYDIKNPPFISNRSSRPRTYYDIPAMQTYTFYLEDKLIIPIGTTKLETQGGARLNNYQPEKLVKSQVGYYFEPRFNIQYNILNNRNSKLFKLFTISAGIGKTYKSPTLYYLYPDKAYYDLAVLDYYTGDPATQTSVFYSMNYATENPDLRPSENFKREVGMDFCLGPVKGNVTAFKEDLTNGFDFISKYVFIDAYKYLTDSIPDGVKPDVSTLPVEHYDYIISYNFPVNNQKTVKSGVEFRLDFGKIKAIYTSFTLDGAYLNTTHVYNTMDYEYLPSSAAPKQYENIGVYPAGESKISERFNTNLRMVTQLPQLRMILSSTVQVTWFDKYYFPEYDEAPMYLFNRAGDIIDFSEEMRTDPAFMRYVDEKTEFYYLTEILPPLFLFNFRLSKEIEDKIKLSLFVNNFMNYRPMYQYVRSESYTRRNPSIYFGAEIKIDL